MTKELPENRLNINSVLVISAHADDHLASAGTLFKLKAKGFQLFEVIMTDSSEGRDYRDSAKARKSRKAISLMRDSELSEASKFLGIQKTIKLDQEDLGLTYSKKLVFEVVPIIRAIKPKIVIIMNSFDFHPDHRETYKIASEAFKWAGSGVKPELGDAFRTPIVLCVEGMMPIEPNILVDITEFADKKAQLLSIYASQSSPKMINFDVSLAAVRGYQLRRKGSLCAEAFSTDPFSPSILFDEII